MTVRPRGLARPSGLAVALVLTAAVVVAGLAGVAFPEHLRTVAAATLGPLERALAPGRVATDTDDARALTATEARRVRGEEQADAVALGRLLGSPVTTGATLTPGRLVALGRPGPAGPERLTLDVGSRDGVTVDTTVVAADGLVGRVVAVAPWTCDVALLGSPDVVVGVRVGPEGRIGTLSATTRSADGVGRLRVELVELGAVQVGDEVSTLGSVDGRPFVAGVPVGRVVAVESARGRATAAALVDPSVGVGGLRVVGVLHGPPRSTPRPVATGGSP